MSNISEATPEDWEDFWYGEDIEDDIVVNMDGGVGGSWYTIKLNQVIPKKTLNY